MSDTLHQQLNKLAQRPEAGAIDASWMQKNKTLLMMQVRNTCADRAQAQNAHTRAERRVPLLETMRLNWSDAFRANRAMPVRALAILALVVVLPMSGWVSTVNASLLSVPGDTLYGVKIMSEKVQLSLASNKKTEITLRTEFAARRADEVIKLKAQNEPTEETQAHIEKTIKRLEQEIKTVSTELDKLAQEKGVTEVIEVARAVDAKSGEIAATLGQSHIPNIEEVQQLIDTTAVKAVETVVQKLNEAKDGGTNTGAIDEQIKFTIEGKLKNAASEIDNVLLAIGDSSQSSTQKTITTQTKTTITEQLKLAAAQIDKALLTLDTTKPSSTPASTLQNDDHQETQDAILAAKDVVERAAQAIQANDFETALDTIKQVKTVIAEAKKAVAVLESEQQPNPALNPPATHATSTPAQAPQKPSEGTIEANLLETTTGTPLVADTPPTDEVPSDGGRNNEETAPDEPSEPTPETTQ